MQRAEIDGIGKIVIKNTNEYYFFHVNGYFALHSVEDYGKNRIRIRRKDRKVFTEKLLEYDFNKLIIESNYTFNLFSIFHLCIAS